MLRALTGLVFPHRCPSCAAPAEWLCTACEETFPTLGSCCARCARPTIVPVDNCSDCRASKPVFTRARAVAIYTGCARDALLAFKLRGERRAARALAQRMTALAPPAGVVTFVPTTRRSLRERGFDPAEELARRVARGLGVRCAPLLRRSRETEDQAGLSRDQRIRNVSGAFRASGRIERGPILLVDDVMTTGATVAACAKALHEAGMVQIGVLTFARAG